MRTPDYTGQFKRHYKRETKGQHRGTLEADLHALIGDWKDHRDCHVKPDLVLIHQKPDADVLRLVRLGSHSELGL